MIDMKNKRYKEKTQKQFGRYIRIISKPYGNAQNENVSFEQKRKTISLKKYTAMAILTAVSLILFTVEAALPPIPIQGVKIGFSNIVTLIAMIFLGRREAFIVLVMRIFLASIFAGSILSFGFSVVGGMMAFVIMALTVNVFGEKKIWIVSVLGAVFHNAGQLAVAIVATGTPSLSLYSPVLLLSAIVTGAIIGMITTALLISPLNRYRIK